MRLSNVLGDIEDEVGDYVVAVEYLKDNGWELFFRVAAGIYI